MKNPAATGLMAKMNIRPEDRVRVKLQILRLIATMRLDREKVDLIAGFVDSYLELTAKEELALQDNLTKLPETKEKQTAMELMTSWERKGRAEGHAEGRQHERLDLVKRLLAHQFGPLPMTVVRQINRLDGDQLSDLAEAFLDFDSVDDLHRWLADAKAD